MRRLSSARCLCALWLLLAACDQQTVHVPEESDPLGWTLLDRFSQDLRARAVWGSGPSDVYAGFDGGAREDNLRHFDGTRWESVSLSGDPYRVYDIWSSAANDVYVAASDGVWHFDGSAWTRTGINATRIRGHDGSHVVATEGRLLLRFNGVTWDSLLVAPRSIRSCWIGAGSTVLASIINYGGADSLFRYDGSTWSSPDSLPGRLNDLWGEDEDDLIGVGGDIYYDGKAWHWDGALWTEMVLPAGTRYLYRAFGLGPTAIYAAGCDMLHYDGAAWEPFDAPEDECIVGIWASSNADIYGVGETSVQRFDGASWNPVFAVKPDEAYAIWADSHERIVVAGSSSVFRFEHGVWTEEGGDSLRSRVLALVGRSWDDLYASTWDGVWHGDGVVWAWMPDSPPRLEVLFVNPGGVLFASDHQYVYRYDAPGWTLIRDTGQEAFIVSLCAPGANDVLAGDTEGISRFDGVAWKQVDHEPGSDLLAFSPRDIYSLSNGRLRYSNGGPFEWVGPILPGGASRLAGTSPDHVVAIGPEAYLAFHNGEWMVGTEPRTGYAIDLVPASDGSVVRLDYLSSDQFQIWYHRE